MFIQDNNCDMPVLSRSDVNTPRMGRYRTGESTEEENRPCNRVPQIASLFFGEAYGTEWLDELIKEFN